MKKNFAKLVNNQLEYFVQPEWILGDASQCAISNGYKEVIYSNEPSVSATEKVIMSYTESQTEITQTFSIVPKNAQDLENDRILDIPYEISKRQFSLVLLSQFNIEYSEVELLVQNVTSLQDKKILEIEWRDGFMFSLTNPIVSLIKDKKNITQRQVEDLFTLAKTL